MNSNFRMNMRHADFSGAFQDPLTILTAYQPNDVVSVLLEADSYLRKGYILAGYVSFEAGYCLETCLLPFMPKRNANANQLPLIAFAVFEDYLAISNQTHCENPQFASSIPLEKPKLNPSWDKKSYIKAFEAVQQNIKNGSSYQVNLTFPMLGSFAGNSETYFKQISKLHPVPYSAYIEHGPYRIHSHSPELFFTIKDGVITTRPMKGTAARSAQADTDKKQALWLKNDTKNLAENRMIVDLLRNDLSRVCQANTVKVHDMFNVEAYASLYQMTSTVKGKQKRHCSVLEIFSSLFPCGSVVGAPKIKTMEIISALENQSRGIYCGTIGVMLPNGDMHFNVAIRTPVLTKREKTYDMQMGVGSGVVADSHADMEYEECLLKAKFLGL